MNWVELLLVVGCSLVVCAVVFTLMRLAAAALRRAAGYFFLAVRPPSLARLTSLVARWLEEWQAAEQAKRGREPPPLPEIVLAFRAFTARARSSVAGPRPLERAPNPGSALTGRRGGPSL